MNGYLRSPFALLALASFTACAESSQPVERSLATVWVLSGGTYHIGSPGASPVSESELPAALAEALHESSDPAKLAVNLEEGAVGYSYLMVRRAACESGVETILASAELPIGATNANSGASDRRIEDAIAGPCTDEAITTQDKPLPRG